MKIIGNAQLGVAPSVVYAALHDPAVLVRCIPGCRRLEVLGEDAYAMTVAAGVGSVKGVYDGGVRLTDHDEPTSFRLHAEGSGVAGTIGADVLVTLAEAAGGGACVTYDADATVGGVIGGVGQRMLVGVSKRMAAEFFDNVGSLLVGGSVALGGSAAPPDRDGAPKPSVVASLLDPPGPSTVAPPPPGASAASPAQGAVFEAPAQRPSGDGSSLVRGVIAGAGAAIAGAFMGAWISRRAAR